MAYKQVAGGMLVQDKDVGSVAADELKVVTKKAPSDEQMADLQFAWKVAKHVKSNAIVYVKNGATVGVGAGQMSRLDSAKRCCSESGAYGRQSWVWMKAWPKVPQWPLTHSSHLRMVCWKPQRPVAPV